MFSSRKDNKPANAVEEVVEVVRIESMEDKIERAIEEKCADDAEFAVAFDQAVKIIYGDRVMFVQHSGIPEDQRPDCTYAEARRGLLAMVARGGDQPVAIYKDIAAYAVQRVLTEGRRFNSKEDVEKAFQAYGAQNRG